MSWPAKISASSAATAKSGVPMKARRRRVVMATIYPAPHEVGRGLTPSRRLGRFLAFRLAQLAQDDVALQRRDVIDEERAFEMIDLVLDAGREQAFGMQFADLVLLVQIADFHLGRPGHI